MTCLQMITLTLKQGRQFQLAMIADVMPAVALAINKAADEINEETADMFERDAIRAAILREIVSYLFQVAPPDPGDHVHPLGLHADYYRTWWAGDDAAREVSS